MKYSKRHPRTEPVMAMVAYKGMRSGCWMANSISRRSLITGNVSTDESKKEIKKSPGAPSAPANPTIFCFQPLRKPSADPFFDLLDALALAGHRAHPAHTANSFAKALPFRNHGRSTLCMYLGKVLFLACNFATHSWASFFFPAALR